MTVLTDTDEVEEVAAPEQPATDTARIDALIERADEFLKLSTDRSVFSTGEVIDFALDARMALIEARSLVPDKLPAELSN